MHEDKCLEGPVTRWQVRKEIPSYEDLPFRNGAVLVPVTPLLKLSRILTKEEGSQECRFRRGSHLASRVCGLTWGSEASSPYPDQLALAVSICIPLSRLLQHTQPPCLRWGGERKGEKEREGREEKREKGVKKEGRERKRKERERGGRERKETGRRRKSEGGRKEGREDSFFSHLGPHSVPTFGEVPTSSDH